MRILILAFALLAAAAPAFANCGANHEAAVGHDTVATTGAPQTPAPGPSGG